MKLTRDITLPIPNGIEECALIVQDTGLNVIGVACGELRECQTLFTFNLECECLTNATVVQCCQNIQILKQTIKKRKLYLQSTFQMQWYGVIMPSLSPLPQKKILRYD